MASSNQLRDDKLRILALHGYRGNAEVFVKKTATIRKHLNRWAEFVYITAPHKVLYVDDPDNLDLGEKLDKEQYGWFFNRDNKTNRGIRNGGPAIGFGESIRIIEEVFREAGPFDGILGFSQGACLAGLLCDFQQRGLLNAKFNFAVIISGFQSKCLPHMKCFTEVINLPSLHVIGECDQIIPKEMSELLCDSFEDPLVFKHSGAHIIPASLMQEEDCQNFIRTQYLLKNS